MDLFAFCTSPALARQLVAAGGAGVVIDWERRGKRRRQAGADTQINTDTADDLSLVRGSTRGRVLCRVNGWSPGTAAELDLARRLGADEVLLPMVRRPEEVDAALAAIGDSPTPRLGILIETQEAVRRVDALVRRPLSRVYVGLNDLMIDRGGSSLFAPLVDGTVDRIRAVVRQAGVPFGVAGLTIPEAGWPVPCRLMIAALARLNVSFTFLRRSFHADMVGRDPLFEVPHLQAAVAAARRRSAAEMAADHREFEDVLGLLADQQAV